MLRLLQLRITIMATITISFHSKNPATIWNTLARKLGREPTDDEANAEVRRIREEALVAVATKGKLPHQRKRSVRA